MESALSHVKERRKFISEAFHSFHQPLTALHCGLELSLLKPRTEEEYRQRGQDALLMAGAVLQLSRAVRELAEAADPGECVGRIELQPFLSKLVEDLSYIAEAGMVVIRLECPKGLFVKADASKLACSLGNIATSLIHSADPATSVVLNVERDDATVSLKLTLEGRRREPEEKDLNQKVAQIRQDAACSYVWAIGGEFRKVKKGFVIELPALG